VSDEDVRRFAAWRDGDTKAGEAFVRAAFPAIKRFFASKVGSEVEELVQRTLTRLVEAKDRWEGRSSARAFVLGIARNVLREHYRGKVRTDDDVEDHSVRDLGAGPSTMRWRRMEDERLLECLRSLPLHMQTVLELSYWDDLTGREIASILEVPEGTVASRLRRAKVRLRAAFDGVAPPDDDDDDASPPEDANLDAWSERVRAAIRP
jgi:RNA polymerase sigma-70 factor (ECF subfamily)